MVLLRYFCTRSMAAVCVFGCLIFVASTTALAADDSSVDTRPPLGTVDVGDYCTVLLAPKLQDELKATDDQRDQLQSWHDRLHFALDHAAGGDTHGRPLTPGLIAGRAHGALGVIGRKVRDVLTPAQEKHLVDLFQAGTLKPIEVRAAVASSGPPAGGRQYIVSGVELIYTHFGETDAATQPGASGNDTIPAPVPDNQPSPRPSHGNNHADSPSSQLPKGATAQFGQKLVVLHEERLVGKSQPQHLLLSPDGATLVAVNRSDLTFWDMTSDHPKVARTVPAADLQLQEIRVPTFSPDGKLMAMGAEDKSVRLYSVGSDGLKQLDSQIEHDAPVSILKFSPDGKLLASGGDDNCVFFWDVADSKLQRRSMFKVEGGIFGVKHIAFSPDGLHAIVNTGNGNVRLVDINGDNPTEKSAFTLPCLFNLPMELSPDGSTLLFGSKSDIRLWRAKEIGAYRVHTGNINAVAWSSDGKDFTSTADDGRLVVWDSTGRVRYVLQRPTKFSDVVFLNKSDGKAGDLWIAAANDNNTIYFLHLGDTGAAPSGNPDSSNRAAVDEDQSVLAMTLPIVENKSR